jgi:FKBP-type peptidyl-prolyl cis-trans isomerase FkpA
MKPVIAIFILMLLTSCYHRPGNKSAEKPSQQRDLIELNKSFISSDRKLIEEYVGKSRLDFSETGTGLWYSIVEKGGGETIKTGDSVTYDYECTLLDGDPCYSGSQTLRVGYAGAERGVTEGLEMMKKGSVYVFIIPPYLAYGLTGDGDKIPGRAILIYRITIKEVS